MSTVVEEVKEVAKSPNGVVARSRAVPVFPFAAAPFAAVTAALVASRLARRRREQAAKPSVHWSLSIATGNRIDFHPTLAPRFSSLFVRGRGRPIGRRFFRR